MPAEHGKPRRWRRQPLIAGATVMSEAALAEADMSAAAAVEGGPAIDPFADTDRDWSQGEVIEVREPSRSTWFDELEASVIAGAAAAGAALTRAPLSRAAPARTRARERSAGRRASRRRR